MDKFKFFKKSAEKKEEPPKPAEAERGAERESRLEKIKNWQIKRAQLLKEILISRAVDNAGNYIPGIDVMKMTIEGAIGKTLSRRELAGKERILYIVSSAMILGFLSPMTRFSGWARQPRSMLLWRRGCSKM